jgi:hypothetical protein
MELPVIRKGGTDPGPPAQGGMTMRFDELYLLTPWTVEKDKNKEDKDKDRSDGGDPDGDPKNNNGGSGTP